jgi:hypothetical protein
MIGPALATRCVSLVALLAFTGAAGASELRDAVDRVRQETGGYILSAQSLQTHRGTVHRVKVLTRDGRVEVRQIAAGVRGDPLGFTPEHRADDGASVAADEQRWQEKSWRGSGRLAEDEGRDGSGDRRRELRADDGLPGDSLGSDDPVRANPSLLESTRPAAESLRFDPPSETGRPTDEPPE